MSYIKVRTVTELGGVPPRSVGWDRYGNPVFVDHHQLSLIGGATIAEPEQHMPLVIAQPLYGNSGTGLDSPCESCATDEQMDARPAPTEDEILAERVADLIHIEFPDTHPHSTANMLRRLSAASRIVSFMRQALGVANRTDGA